MLEFLHNLLSWVRKFLWNNRFACSLPSSFERYTTYAEAVKASISSKKLLLVYFHAPFHHLTANFVSTVINTENLQSCIQNYSIFTADLCSYDGYSLKQKSKPTFFPCFVVLSTSKQGNKLTAKIVSKVYTTDINRLVTILEKYADEKRKEEEEILKRQQEAEERRRIIEQQDADFERSRLEDFKKQKLKRDKEAQANLLVDLKVKFGDLNRKEGNGSVLRLVLSSGKKVTHKFSKGDKNSELWNFLEYLLLSEKEGEDPLDFSNFELRLNFPRKIFPYGGEPEKSIEATFGKQAVLFVQDLES
eukprot:maker-scaffold_20-snap-gene-3.38-mRNA-1 protein AED:0.02 eAED:0.02 QI:101/1/1/1/1/1/3/699/303